LIVAQLAIARLEDATDLQHHHHVLLIGSAQLVGKAERELLIGQKWHVKQEAAVRHLARVVDPPDPDFVS